MYVYIYIINLYMNEDMHIYTCIYIYMYMYACIHICMYLYIYE